MKFIDMFDKFFDCVNVRNFVSGQHSKNAFKSPYQSSDDFRLEVWQCCKNDLYGHK